MLDIIIPTHVLKASLLFAAKGDKRYYLNGIYLEAGPAGARLTSTDGHVFAMIRLEGEGYETTKAILPRETVEGALKVSARAAHLQLTLEGQKFTLGGVAGQLIDARYPDYHRVIPKEPASGELAQYDPRLLVKFSDAAKLLNPSKRDKKEFIPVVHHNDHRAAPVDINVPDFRGVVMPFRHDPQPYKIPSWVDTDLQSKPAEPAPQGTENPGG